MPARSKAQQRLFAACEHGAGYASCPKGMTKAQMHDFAATPRKGLPQRVKMKRGGVVKNKASRKMKECCAEMKRLGIRI